MAAGAFLGLVLAIVAVPIGLVRLFDLLDETGDLPTTVAAVYSQLPMLFLIAALTAAALLIIGSLMAVSRRYGV
jgi:hypothetical protein